MPTITFVARAIGTLGVPDGKEREEYFDKTMPGFGLRVTRSGHRTWIYLYRHKGEPRRYTFRPPYPQLGLAEAKQQARAIRSRVSNGEDPATEKTKERAGETVRDITTLYIDEHAKQAKRTWRADQRILEKDVISRWGSRKATDITRGDVRAMLRAIKQRGAPIQSNRTLEIVRKMFNWAIAEELLENNPCDHVAKLSRENERTRVLSPAEIRTLWTVLDTRRSPLVAAVYRLLLLTGQRSIEVVGAERQEIGTDGWWTIPAGRVKNKQEHRVWLCDTARQILADIEPYREQLLAGLDAKTRAKARNFIFPSENGGHLRCLQKTHQRLREVSGLTNFKIHDLRRTTGSLMSEMGISRLTISKILNHKESGVTRIYDRYSYAAEIQHALNAWDARLQEILSGSDQPGNVVALRPRELLRG